MRRYLHNSDDSLRRAFRAWGSSGAPEDYTEFVRERGRMGLYGVVSPEPRGARALLAAWPRYKSGKRKGQPRRNITYGLANKLVRDYYQGAGWLSKLYIGRDKNAVPETHYVTRVEAESSGGHPTTALPKGFPSERDPDWAPIQFGALISPGFDVSLWTVGVRSFLFAVWSQSDGMWSNTLGAAPRWELRALNEDSPWAPQTTVDKKRLAFLLLDASLRVEDPYMPNPPRDLAPEVYVSPRERELTPHEQRVREVAIGLKTGEPWAVETAADAMAPLIPRGATLVAVPGHKRGRPGMGTSRLVHAIAARTEGLIRCPLERSFQVQSSLDRRRAGKGGLSPKSHAASMKARPVPQGPLGTPLVLIDNVVVSGATFEGARRALGRPDALAVAYARGRDVVLARANPDEDLRRLERAAAAGDPEAHARMLVHMHRSGTPYSGRESFHPLQGCLACDRPYHEHSTQEALRSPADPPGTRYTEFGEACPGCRGDDSRWVDPGVHKIEGDDLVVRNGPLRRNPPARLPSLKVQRRIAAGLDEATSATDEMLARAQKAVKLTQDLRMAHLQQAFGSARKIHERLNPIQGLGGLIELRTGGEADFYIQRSGTPGNVGRPFREAFPETAGRARRGPGDPRHHIGVTVLRPDVLDPRFLFYVAEYAWRAGIYRRLCTGSLPLQHLRLKDVACGLNAVISGVKRNPVSSHYWTGGCYHLALALNELAGWPVVAMVNDDTGFVDHAGVESPKGQFVDGHGAFATVQDAEDRLGLRATRMSPAELAKRTITEPADDQDRAAAAQVIGTFRKNPVSDRGRYRFVHACPAAHCGEDIQDMVDAAREITYRTFRAKADPGDVGELIAGLGYDHHFPITRDLWHVGFRKSVYRGVPAVYLVHSAIEHIFTLDGKLGPSLLEGPREPDPIADAWQAQAQAKTKWGRWAP